MKVFTLVRMNSATKYANFSLPGRVEADAAIAEALQHAAEESDEAFSIWDVMVLTRRRDGHHDIEVLYHRRSLN